MARELVKLGYRVTVVTVDWRDGDDVDDGRDGIAVVRVDPRRWFPAFVPRPPHTTERPIANPVQRKLTTLRRVLRWGPFESWARAALDELLRVHAKERVDVVWAIHGDDSSHEIAYRFHRRTGVPWVADYKDPWNLFHQGVLERVQRLATTRRLRTAAMLTETAAAQGAWDGERFQRPWRLVYSGYDADLMEAATSVRTGEAFSLLYVGNLGPQHDVAAVAKLLAAARAQTPSRSVELHLFGHGFGALFEHLKAHDVEDMVVRHPFVPLAEAYGRMRGAGALLLLPATHWVPSGGSVGVKELEYFASGTPVLSLGALIPEMSRIAERCSNVFQSPDVSSAAAFLRDESEALAAGRPSPRRAPVNGGAITEYSWPSVAAKLADALDESMGLAPRRRDARSIGANGVGRDHVE